jgi:hypothetical protein
MPTPVEENDSTQDLPEYNDFGRGVMSVMYGPANRWPSHVTGDVADPENTVAIVDGSHTQKIYLAFLARGGRATAKQISLATGISMRDCRNFIHHLHTRGLLAQTDSYEVAGGRRHRFWQLGAVHPDNVRYVSGVHCSV